MSIGTGTRFSNGRRSSLPGLLDPAKPRLLRWFGIGYLVSPAVLFISVTAAIILQISGIRYPAPFKKPAIMIFLFLLFLAFLVLWFADSPAATWWGIGMILLGYWYSLVYPFIQKK